MLSLLITLTYPFRISSNVMDFQGPQTSILILQIFGSVTRKLFRGVRKIFIFLAYPFLSLSVHAEQHREEGRVVALEGLGMAHSLQNSLAQRLLYR